MYLTQQESRSVERLSNVLPPHFDSWLRFYDSIPVHALEEPVIQMEELYDSQSYQRYFKRAPMASTLDGRYYVVIAVDRDFYLARVAEELLKSRVSRDEYRAAMMASRSRDFNTQPVDLVLEKAGKVAYRGEGR